MTIGEWRIVQCHLRLSIIDKTILYQDYDHFSGQQANSSNVCLFERANVCMYIMGKTIINSCIFYRI